MSQPNETEITNIKKKLTAVKELAKNNIDKILIRGDKIDQLVDKSGYLEHSSSEFYRSTRSLKRKMCCKKVKCIILSLLVIGFFTYLLLFTICGSADLKNC